MRLPRQSSARRTTRNDRLSKLASAGQTGFSEQISGDKHREETAQRGLQKK